MDPLTAAFNMVTEAIKLIALIIESQPPEVRAEFAKLQLTQLQAWQAFVERFNPKG